MRTRILLVLLVVAAASLPALARAPIAVAAAPQADHGVRGRASAHARVNFKDAAADEARHPRPHTPHGGIEEGRPLRYLSSGDDGPSRAPASGPVAAQAPSSPGTVSEFDASADNNTAVPPDTHGAVGPNHVMTVLNTVVQVHARTGGAPVSSVTLDGFWNALLPGSTFAFDPKVFYDSGKARWIFVAVRGVESPSSAVLIGVSQSTDPTGDWNLYAIDADSNDGLWADYPSVGFNRNWITVQVNMFPISAAPYEGRIFVFDKVDALYTGSGAPHTMFSDPDGFAQAPAVTNDSTTDTQFLVEDWSGVDNDHGGQGTLRIRRITPGGDGKPQLLGTSVYAVGSPWQDMPNSNNFGAPQLGDAHKIDIGDARMQNCVLRSGSLWCAHTILLPADATPTHTAVQWWQISTASLGTVQQRGRIEDAAKWFAYPSIAVNKANDALIGYSTFGSQQYASANYSFRSHADALSTMRADRVLKAGLAKYYKTLSGNENRWGDYSNTSVDPANDADFWTVQEYAAAPVNGVDKWGTFWGHIAATTFSFPGTLTAPLKMTFGRTAKNVTTDNFELLVGSSAVPAALSCKGPSGATVACGTGPVQDAYLQPTSRLVPGEHYTAVLNPGGATAPALENDTDIAFDSESQAFRAPLLEQESSLAARYLWRTDAASSAYGGSYMSERTAGSRAHFRFTLPSAAVVAWYTVSGRNMGMADVYVDNVKKATYSQYASVATYKVRHSFSLPAGIHVLSIVVLGKKGTSSATDTRIAIDAFKVGATLYSSPVLTMSGKIMVTSAASGGKYETTTMPGSNLYFTFHGTGIDWYTVTGPSQGKANVYIDGAFKGTIDNYASSTHYKVKRSYRSLSDGAHTMRIVITGTKNTRSAGTSVCVDAWGII
ncbi:MAG: hypothetical protein LC750_14385 [Actinobacteria bacterium]|nr:hypothetical protein [Actinomycetota bacterium]